MKIPGTEITLQNAQEIIRAGDAAVKSGDGAFDFSGIRRADSSAVAALLHWKRLCRSSGAEFRIEPLPEGLSVLCRLYGVDRILGIPARS